MVTEEWLCFGKARFFGKTTTYFGLLSSGSEGIDVQGGASKIARSAEVLFLLFLNNMLMMIFLALQDIGAVRSSTADSAQSSRHGEPGSTLHQV